MRWHSTPLGPYKLMVGPSDVGLPIDGRCWLLLRNGSVVWKAITAAYEDRPELRREEFPFELDVG